MFNIWRYQYHILPRIVNLLSFQGYKSRCDGQMNAQRRGQTSLRTTSSHLARPGAWGAWHWAWGGASPSSLHWHCRSPPVGSSCQKQPVGKPPPSGNRPLVQTQSRCQIPVRSQQAKTTTDHPVTSLLIFIKDRFKRPSDYQIERDPFPRPVTGGLLHGVAVRCAPTDIHRQDRRVTNDADNPLRAQFHLLSPPSAASWLNLPRVCVCVWERGPPTGHTQTHAQK